MSPCWRRFTNTVLNWLLTGVAMRGRDSQPPSSAGGGGSLSRSHGAVVNSISDSLQRAGFVAARDLPPPPPPQQQQVLAAGMTSRGDGGNVPSPQLMHHYGKR